MPPFFRVSDSLIIFKATRFSLKILITHKLASSYTYILVIILENTLLCDIYINFVLFFSVVVLFYRYWKCQYLS